MLRKILSLTLSISLLFQYSGFAQSINLADYLTVGTAQCAVPTDRFRPLALRYFSYEPAVDNFRILLDKGDQKDLSDTKIKDEADKLLTYFKIGLTLPNEKFWVNLRPDAEDQIIDPELEKTDLGKVLLEADLQLKKDTSSLTSPQSKEGKAYWDKLYKKAGELFGTENITIPTITRPWIVPGEIIVRESKDSAYIYKAVLKVMLEEDYLTSRGGSRTAPTYQQYAFSDPRLKELNKYSTELIRETILPELTKRINSSKDYANLRQVFFSLILARWFKDSFSNSGSVSAPGARAPENSYIKLIDSQDLTNLTSKNAWSKTVYFNEYKKSFKDGEYNLSEPIYTPTGQVIRRYMSGGESFNVMNMEGFTAKETTAGSAIEGNPDKVVFTGDEIGTQEQTTSSPLQKRRLEDVIPIIEKILSGITLKKINEKGMRSQYTFEIKKIQEDTAIGGTWNPTKDNSLEDNLNVWSSRGHELAGLNHHSLAGPYVKIDYILYVIPGKTRGVDLIRAVSLIIKAEGMSDEIKKDFEKAIKNTAGFSLSNPINAKKPKKGAGSPINKEMAEDYEKIIKELTAKIESSKKADEAGKIHFYLLLNNHISRLPEPGSIEKISWSVGFLQSIDKTRKTLELPLGLNSMPNKIRDAIESSLNKLDALAERVKEAATQAGPAVGLDNKLAEEFNKFDQRLKDGDKAVLDEIVDFYNGIPYGNAKKMEFYKWLQNHQSALAAKAQLKIGLDWKMVVPELVAIAKGKSSYGNPYSAARQLHELVSQGTFGGLTNVPPEVIREAEKAWQENPGLTHFLAPVILPAFPIVKENQKPGYLVIERHGQASFSEDAYNRWAGWLKSLITAKGRAEARNGGVKLYGVRFDEAYSSDLSRAVDTLDEFLIGIGQTDIPRKETKALREKNYGWLGGQSRKDLEELFGKEQFTQWRRAINGRVPLGESLADTKERAGKYILEEILPAIAAGKNVVISAHGNSLRSLLVILREHTLGRILNDEEIIKLEVPNSVPIAIKFDAQLKHEEMWSNQHSPEEVLAFLQSGSPLLEKKKDEFEKLLAGISGRIARNSKTPEKTDEDLDKISQEIDSLLIKEMDSVSDLNGLREKVNAAIAKMLSYKDAGRIDKEIGKLKELYASLNANILADRFYRAGLTKSKLEGITTKDIKPIEIKNEGHGLPGSYYVSRYHLLGTITVESAEYYVKVSHDEEGRRPYRIMELVPKDKSDTLEPLIRFRVFDDGIAPEISYAGHKEPKKKDSDEPNWKEAKRKAFSGLFNAKPQEVDKLQDFVVSEVNRILTAASAIVTRPESAQAAMLDGFGGIDLRQMNMLIQPQGSFASSSLDFSLPALSRAEIEAFDLDKELELIQMMASSGIDPIDERFKRYLAVCFARGKVGKEIDELKLCLEDVFTAQQLDARETPDGYKEVIVIADTRRYVLKESRLAASSGQRINLN